MEQLVVTFALLVVFGTAGLVAVAVERRNARERRQAREQAAARHAQG